MALSRKKAEVFGSTASNTAITEFGTTANLETVSYSKDPDIIQNANYKTGWTPPQSETDNQNLPYMEDMNAVLYTMSYLNAYLYENGIAEWNENTAYKAGGLCRINLNIYQCNADNINSSPLTNTSLWELLNLVPPDGVNVGLGENIYLGKDANNDLQFRTLKVSGNASISVTEDNELEISVGGGDAGTVYWGGIQGTITDQSDLQQALSQKQNTIGYTPENTSNKTTTIQDVSLASNVKYPTEKATATAINAGVTEAKSYTDDLVSTLSSNAFVLYAKTDGTLTTTAPTGAGTYITADIASQSLTFQPILNATYTTTEVVTINNTFSYDFLVPLYDLDTGAGYQFAVSYSISHPEVLGGVPVNVVNYTSPVIHPTNARYIMEIKQDNLSIDDYTFPVGATISFSITGKIVAYETKDTVQLLVYDQNFPVVASRNRSVNKNLASAINTYATGVLQSQETFNEEVYDRARTNALALYDKQDLLDGTGFVKASGTTITYDNTDYIPLAGSALISGDLRPVTTNVYAVGGANAYWKQGCFTNLYSSHGYIQKITSSSALILGGSGVVQLYANSDTTNSLYFNSSSLYPGADNIVDVGTTGASYSSMWSYCYKVRNNSSQYPAVGEYGIIADKGYLDLCGRGGTGGGIRIWGLNNAHLGTWDNQGIYTRASGTLGSSTYRWGRTYLEQGAPLDLNGTLFLHESSGNKRTMIKRTETSGGIFIVDSDEVGVRLGHGSTSWATVSDRRQKKNIVELEDSLDIINALNPIRFNYKEEKEDAPSRVGFVAQDIREVIPEAVTGEETETEFLAVSMTEIIPFLVKSVQELSAKVDELIVENEILKTEIEALKK